MDSRLRDVVETDLSRYFLEIPFEAWRLICNKTREVLTGDDSKHKFPEITEEKARLWYVRYCYHCKENCASFLKSVLTAYPDSSWPAAVEILIKKRILKAKDDNHSSNSPRKSSNQREAETQTSRKIKKRTHKRKSTDLIKGVLTNCDQESVCLLPKKRRPLVDVAKCINPEAPMAKSRIQCQQADESTRASPAVKSESAPNQSTAMSQRQRRNSASEVHQKDVELIELQLQNPSQQTYHYAATSMKIDIPSTVINMKREGSTKNVEPPVEGSRSKNARPTFREITAEIEDWRRRNQMYMNSGSPLVKVDKNDNHSGLMQHLKLNLPPDTKGIARHDPFVSLIPAKVKKERVSEDSGGSIAILISDESEVEYLGKVKTIKVYEKEGTKAGTATFDDLSDVRIDLQTVKEESSSSGEEFDPAELGKYFERRRNGVQEEPSTTLDAPISTSGFFPDKTNFEINRKEPEKHLVGIADAGAMQQKNVPEVMKDKDEIVILSMSEPATKATRKSLNQASVVEGTKAFQHNAPEEFGDPRTLPKTCVRNNPKVLTQNKITEILPQRPPLISGTPPVNQNFVNFYRQPIPAGTWLNFNPAWPLPQAPGHPPSDAFAQFWQSGSFVGQPRTNCWTFGSSGRPSQGGDPTKDILRFRRPK